MKKQDVILEYIKTLAPTNVTITVSSSLFGGRLLDSMALTELIGFLEENFSITVRPLDISPENLDSVEQIAAYVEASSPSI